MAKGRFPTPPEEPGVPLPAEAPQDPLGPLAWAWDRVVYYRRAIGDVAVSAVPQIVGVVSGLVSSVLIARGLGPVGMGKYALVMSVSGLVTHLSDLGIGMTAVRYASRAVAAGNESLQFAVLRWAFRVRMTTTVGASVGALLAAGLVCGRLWHDPGLSPYVRWSLLLGLWYAVANVPYVYFQSLKRFAMGATVQVAQTLIQLSGIIALAVLKRWSLDAILGVCIVAAAVSCLLALALVPRGIVVGPLAAPPGASLWQRWVSPPRMDNGGGQEAVGAFAGYVVLGSAITSVVMRLDLWIMGALLPQAQVGVYQVAGRFAIPLAVVLGAIHTALWPRASAATDPAELVHLLRRSLKFTALAGTVALVWALSGPLLAPWLFGAAYAGATGIGWLLCLRYVIALVVAPLGLIGYSFGLARYYWRVYLLQAAVVTLTNLWLLPRVGPVGAAWALIAHEVIGGLIIAVLLWRACRKGLLGEASRKEAAP